MSFQPRWAQHHHLQGAGVDLSIRDVPLSPHPGKKCFVLTYVVLGQIVALLSNLLLTYKETRKPTEAEEKQCRRSPFVSLSSDDLDNDNVCPGWASLICVW